VENGMHQLKKRQKSLESSSSSIESNASLEVALGLAQAWSIILATNIILLQSGSSFFVGKVMCGFELALKVLNFVQYLFTIAYYETPASFILVEIASAI
jgi:hypothetical protein